MPGPFKPWSFSCACWLAIVGWLVGLQCVGSELIIIRKVNMKDVYHKDRFNIPRSKCTDIRQGNKCAVYGGFERSPSNPCKCQCPPLKGTMVLHKNRWKCTGNEVLRLREGCGFRFPYESSKAFIKMVLQNQWQFLHAATSGCTLETMNTSYLACNGSWVRSPRLSRNIDVISRGFDQVARGYAYQVKVRKNSFTSGKMIKLSLTCRPFGGKPCLLLKTRGNQNCFFQRRRAYRKKFRKNKKATKGLSLYLLSSQSPSSVKGLLTPSHVRGKPRIRGTRKKKDESRADSKTTRDEGVTTIILISAASLLGATIVVLTINLFFCSSNQETFKAKYIFRGRNDMRKSEGKMIRTQSQPNSSPHSSDCAANKLSLNLCSNTIPRSANTSNTELTIDSRDEIQGFTSNSQASSQTSQQERELPSSELLTAGEEKPSPNSNVDVWTKI